MRRITLINSTTVNIFRVHNVAWKPEISIISVFEGHVVGHWCINQNSASLLHCCKLRLPTNTHMQRLNYYLPGHVAGCWRRVYFGLTGIYGQEAANQSIDLDIRVPQGYPMHPQFSLVTLENPLHTKIAFFFIL